jgi:hypothetical protein
MVKVNIRPHEDAYTGISNTAIVKRLELHLRLIHEIMGRIEKLEEAREKH